jgi:hypothetical protein
MKTLILAAALVAATPAFAQQVGVSISVGQPGFYGRIDLGSFGPPPVVYSQPVIIERNVRYVGEPVYLRVPPGHQKNWSKHCGQYNACGQRVLFVRDDWYTNSYVPRYQEEHRGHGRDRDRERDHDRDDRDDDHGHGQGHGHGKGHDKHGN